MATKPSYKSTRKHTRLTAAGVWKGENETDPELIERADKSHSLIEAEAWTEDEAYTVYREKLVRLRDLYVGQLGHLKHVLQEKRREFLQRWQHEGGTLQQAAQPSQGGSLEDAAYRCYRKRSGEEALLERKQKQRRISASLDYFCKREVRDLHKSHYQYLTKLHQQSNSKDPCTTAGCEHTCLPYSNRCSRHICDDEKQLFYTKCSYKYPSGTQCTNPVPLHINPPLCGGHCDNVALNPAENEGCGSTATDEPARKSSDLHASTAHTELNNVGVKIEGTEIQR